MDYTIKDSGQRQDFPTGSVRDTRDGKGRFDLIPPLFLRRLAAVYEKGAAKYGDNNWQKGQPLRRFFDSTMRHLMAVREGQEDEDHLFQAIWNIGGIAWTLEEIRARRLPAELNDLPYSSVDPILSPLPRASPVPKTARHFKVIRSAGEESVEDTRVEGIRVEDYVDAETIDKTLSEDGVHLCLAWNCFRTIGNPHFTIFCNTHEWQATGGAFETPDGCA